MNEYFIKLLSCIAFAQFDLEMRVGFRDWNTMRMMSGQGRLLCLLFYRMPNQYVSGSRARQIQIAA